jgi:hypothetical protein
LACTSRLFLAALCFCSYSDKLVHLQAFCRSKQNFLCLGSPIISLPLTESFFSFWVVWKSQSFEKRNQMMQFPLETFFFFQKEEEEEECC